MDRATSLLRYADIDNECGLEIGPLDKALVERRPGRRIYYCDYATREVLRQKSSADPSVDIERIPEIDFVTTQIRAETFGDIRFDYILASHVIEHVPDMLGWLNHLLQSLRPGGRIILAIPDKRYTFDYLRPESTLGQIMEAHLEQRVRPSFSQVYDAFGMAVKADTRVCWEHAVYPAPLVPYYTKDFALGLAKDARDAGGYHDCHCWVFTFESFLALAEEARIVGALPARIAQSSAPVFGANEFHVVFEHADFPASTPRRVGKSTETALPAALPGAELPPGVIIRSLESRFGERVFFAAGGRRHWIRDSRWFAQHGRAWPDDVTAVKPEVLESYRLAGSAPMAWSDADVAHPPADADFTALREIAGRHLRGVGVEFGAGAAPYPVPLSCRVLFADRLGTEDLTKALYPGQAKEDLVAPDIVSDIESCENIEPESLDFVVACHVIEHTRNPIGSIVEAWKRLRPGGSLVLSVPRADRTFDRHREVTPLAHLVLDFQSPDRARDYAHYEEFFTRAFPLEKDVFRQRVDAAFAESFSIHYHVWTHDSFLEMVDWIRANVAPFASVWSHPGGPSAERDIEFHIVLTK